MSHTGNTITLCPFCRKALSKTRKNEGKQQRPPFALLPSNSGTNVFMYFVLLREWNPPLISHQAVSIILLFENVNYKVKSTSKLLQVSRELLYVLFSETDNLKSILLKAALQKKTSRREANCNMSKFNK